MRWWLLVFGLIFQVSGAICYLTAVYSARKLSRSEQLQLPTRSLLKPPFLFLSLCSVCMGSGVMLVSAFALIDSDLVLLLTQVFLAVIISLLLVRFRLF